MSEKISGVMLLNVCTVLEECENKLAILGNIMPHYNKAHPEAAIAEVGDEMEQLRKAEQNVNEARLTGWSDLKEAIQELQRSHQEVTHRDVASPWSSKKLTKFERDRQFVAKVITDVLVELREKGTFESLFQAVEEKKKKKAQLQDIIKRDQECSQAIEDLQKQLVDIRKEEAWDLAKRDEMIAHLKDQLQEATFKTGLEREYVKNSVELQVYQAQKLNALSQKELQDEILLLLKKIEEEKCVHKETETFLKKHQANLEEKLEFWMQRYERDTEEKEKEMDTLRSSKANNLTKLQDLAKRCVECEKVIIEDRMKKENLQMQREKELLERQSATKIQAWWRGTMVRKGLGALKKAKKPKAKPGKKDRKKK
ncbi:dynein regulatory complex protein 9 isoform X2 [Denticeps clupeoides]|nr:dynein regulatory complex protein 9 isoform X2 [Denticeps clupeoides]